MKNKDDGNQSCESSNELKFRSFACSNSNVLETDSVSESDFAVKKKKPNS